MLQAELKVLEGKFQGKAIPLNTRKFLVGREQDCHLRPNSDMVSRHHCVFSIDEYAVRLRDLGSTNGTKVNGELIRTEIVLNDGDQISIGKLDLQFCLRNEAAAATAEVVSPSPLSGFEVPVPQSASETNYEIPQFEPPNPAGSGIAGDTAIFGAQAPPPGYPLGMPMGGFLPQPVYPGQPMAGYPQYPQQGYGMPMGYPPGYPPMYPGGAMPGYPQMPYQQPYPGQPAVSVAAPAPGDAAAAADAIPTKLPDPESTGIKIPAPPPAAAAGAAPAQSDKPSNTAADIIKQYMQRRTTK